MERTFDKDLLERQLDRVADANLFLRTIGEIDLLNDDDPKRVALGKCNVGYELYFATQLTRWVLDLAPAASEALMLAARGQHICRWMIPREDYPRDRAGYLAWRADLKKFHAHKMMNVLQMMGYDEAMQARVADLNLKKGIKKDPECQTLEDALCLVFLEKQFADFSEKTDEEKMVGILQKSWAKMSEAGREAALSLELNEPCRKLVEKALAS
ncbi:DUF4202 domain-containing protein [Pelagicoccus sp. SDUM812005]|uniref:DUF4202 domain-containing protein n=1 Tax=Pelagicoccus sp. SDUM812005 TaxID=3041257 RepID=UPI00280D6B0D|nr:DUF4202 domain-containing protein [Pelagicoccus sp. SDUM812005]MDQ8182111.1 DUF4202 domain-containing protein [Pelagicoccus sp. SDUM812005]